MSRYVRSSTENPYGHTPWQTALYTTFGDFAWLKQPQNTVVREPADIAPRIRKPPELAGVTIVGGSGRVLGTLGYDLSPSELRFASIWRMAGGTPFRVIPTPSAPLRVVTPTTPLAVASPVRVAPIAPIRAVGVESCAPCQPAPTPTPVMTSSGALSTYTPGAPGAAGSPFAAAAVTGPPPAADSRPAPSFLDQARAWLAGSMFAGIPNYFLVIGGGLLLARSGDSRKGRF